MAKTIFILGAGASVPYGFPSGESLIRLIIEQLSHLIDPGNRQRDPLARLMQENGEIKVQHCDEFQQALIRSGAYSIDAFLERRPEFRQLGKTIIAFILLNAEYYCFTNNILFQPIQPQEHWYRYFFNEIKDHTQFKFKIYTFNYERSLEYFLIESYRNFFKYSDDIIFDRIQAMSITHLHGSLGSLDSLNSLSKINNKKTHIINNYSQLEEISERIEIIYEVGGSKLEGLQDDILYASNIVFIGFGFDKMNMRNIGLKKMEFTKGSDKKFYASTYGLSSNEVQQRLLSHLNFTTPKDIKSNSFLPVTMNPYTMMPDPIIIASETASNFLKNTLPHSTYTN